MQIYYADKTNMSYSNIHLLILKSLAHIQVQHQHLLLACLHYAISFNFIKKGEILYKVVKPNAALNTYFIYVCPFGGDVMRSSTNRYDTIINMDGMMTYLVHNMSLRTRDSYIRTTVRNRLICKCHRVGRGRAVHMRLLRCCASPAK